MSPSITVTLPAGARAVLVFVDDRTSGLKCQPVEHNQAVLNIESELLKHLNERPYSVEWLTVLRAYCDQRLAARTKAQATGCVMTPNPSFDWEMTSLAALRACS